MKEFISLRHIFEGEFFRIPLYYFSAKLFLDFITYCNISMARIATQIFPGEKLSDFNLKKRSIKHYGVKEEVFQLKMFPAIDPLPSGLSPI
jgi:hypothetical protein